MLLKYLHKWLLQWAYIDNSGATSKELLNEMLEEQRKILELQQELIRLREQEEQEAEDEESTSRGSRRGKGKGKGKGTVGKAISSLKRALGAEIDNQSIASTSSRSSLWADDVAAQLKQAEERLQKLKTTPVQKEIHLTEVSLYLDNNRLGKFVPFYFHLKKKVEV